jgi:hypothetical protein
MDPLKPMAAVFAVAAWQEGITQCEAADASIGSFQQSSIMLGDIAWRSVRDRRITTETVRDFGR